MTNENNNTNPTEGKLGERIAEAERTLAEEYDGNIIEYLDKKHDTLVINSAYGQTNSVPQDCMDKLRKFFGTEWDETLGGEIIYGLREIVSDGTFRGPRYTWYTTEEGIIEDECGNYLEERIDDPNADIWGKLPGQHPNRWITAIRNLGYDVPKAAMIVSIGADEYGQGGTLEIMDEETMEYLGADQQKDGMDKFFKAQDGKLVIWSQSYWQGSPDYQASVSDWPICDMCGKEKKPSEIKTVWNRLGEGISEEICDECRGD
jgi:hypothetical protein